MVDINVNKFVRHVRDSEPFKHEGKRNKDVVRTGIPAWKAPFSASVLMHHSQYTIPSFYYFKESFIAYIEQHANFETKYKTLWFDVNGNLTPGAMERLCMCYEGGMNELFIYCALKEILEDKLGIGTVWYDAINDWKNKIDILVLIDNKPVIVDIVTNIDEDERKQYRDLKKGIEKDRKKNVRDFDASFPQTKSLDRLYIHIKDEDSMVVNGLKLLSIDGLNNVLDRVYDYYDLDEDRRLTADILRINPALEGKT